MLVNADLHIHSKYSAATSRDMDIEGLSRGAVQKGIQMIGSGDCQHPKWFKEITGYEEIDEGTYQVGGLRVVLTTEIEVQGKIHHLLMFPSASSVEDFRERIASKTKQMVSDGRPYVRVNGEELAQTAVDVEALFGPAHAFTPWTAIYGANSSLDECYGALASKVSFIELGLSADTSYADRIEELQNITFLTNSDAHSPTPHRLAREFNRFEMQDNTASELRKALHRVGGRGPILNVGMPPQEGKYNESACIKCLNHFTLQEARDLNWRCSCSGRIKRGVKDRIGELASWPEPRHPDHRPDYVHIIPLAEIIAKSLGIKTVTSKGVRSRWEPLIERFGDEVTVLVDADIEDIAKATEPRVASGIRCFREGRVIFHPGGGGEYGSFDIPIEKMNLLDF